MFKECQKHVKIIYIKDQKQNKKFCEDENIQFNFIGTKIKICNIYNCIYGQAGLFDLPNCMAWP